MIWSFFFGSAKRVQTGYDKLSVVAKLKRERETTSSMACVHKYAMWKYIYGTMEIDCLIFFSFQKDVWILFDKLQRERLGHVRPISTATIARLQSRRNEMCVVFSLNIQWMYGDHIYARLRSSKTRLGGKMKQFFDSLPISDRAAACWGGELRALSQSRDLNLCVWCYQSASGESSPWMWNKKKRSKASAQPKSHSAMTTNVKVETSWVRVQLQDRKNFIRALCLFAVLWCKLLFFYVFH